jgi:hypothetical protein
MATVKPLPFRRRTFLVRRTFQVRFAAYPIAFLALFLALAGGYLYIHLREVLHLQVYLPHSRLQDPWQVLTPALGRVALWGGGALLVVLSGWVWIRFARLRRDLDQLTDWLNLLGREEAAGAPPRLRDPEVRALGERMGDAAGIFDAWRQGVAEKGTALLGLTEPLARGEGGDPSALRRAIAAVCGAIAEVRLEEDPR